MEISGCAVWSIMGKNLLRPEDVIKWNNGTTSGVVVELIQSLFISVR